MTPALPGRPRKAAGWWGSRAGRLRKAAGWWGSRAGRLRKAADWWGSRAGRLRMAAGWWGSRGAVARDSWLAAVLAAAAFVPALSGLGAQFGDLPQRHADPFAAALLLGQTLPLAVRSRWPAACLAVVGTSFAVHESLGYPPAFGSLGLYLALYSAGAWQQRLRWVLPATAAAAYVIFSVTLHLLGSPERLADYAVFALALAAFWVVGAFVRRHRAEEATRRALEAREATAAERSRIARELHDVVTHHVTAMVVQADAAQYLTAAPDRTEESLTAISGTGRRALAELRYLLGVLEATGESAPAGRTPVLGTLRDLVEQTRLGGQPVDFTEEGERPALAIGAELAVYRVVQETLTNAVKHAAGQRTVVHVRYHRDLAEVDVTTAGAVELAAAPGGPLSRDPLRGGPPPPGHRGTLPPGGRGLAGLHERVRMLGGELAAAGQPDGSFRVSARIPAGSGS